LWGHGIDRNEGAKLRSEDYGARDSPRKRQTARRVMRHSAKEYPRYDQFAPPPKIIIPQNKPYGYQILPIPPYDSRPLPAQQSLCPLARSR
jgi:hypothetical protein